MSPSDRVSGAIPTIDPPQYGLKIHYERSRRVAVSSQTLEAHRLLHATAKAEVTDAYGLIRTQVLQRLESAGWRSVAVISAEDGEGKSTTAANLAISIARDPEHSVLLVDLDLRRPSIAPLFGVYPERGVIDHLLHDVSLSELLFHPSIERLLVLPGHQSYSQSAELLASDRVRDFAAELRTRYADRVVIFDLPGAVTCDDAMAFLPNVDAVILVVRDGFTKVEQLQRMQYLLGQKPVLGWVFNASRE